MKPVGLSDPRTGRRPFAVVQLRQDNLAASHFSMVGFQTQLKWGEQTRVFRMIPGLERAEFVRLGMIHRNTFINSPATLEPTFEARRRPGLFFAGQMSGVEGYVESAASGLLAGIGAAARARGAEPVAFPEDTALGALGTVYRQKRRRELPADQHRLWAAAGADREDSGQEQKTAGAVGQGTPFPGELPAPRRGWRRPGGGHTG